MPDSENQSKLFLPFSRYIKAINSINDIDKAIDFRTTLEILFNTESPGIKNKLSNRICNLFDNFYYKECANLYAFLSEAAHDGIFTNKYNSNQMFKLCNSIFVKTMMYFIDNNIYLSDKDWKKMCVDKSNEEYVAKEEEMIIRVHGLVRKETDSFSIEDNKLIINGNEYEIINPPTFNESNESPFFIHNNIVNLYLKIEKKQQFIFINTNMKKFLGFYWNDLRLKDLKLLINYLNWTEERRRKYNKTVLDCSTVAS